MKKLSLLIALILCVTVGGVYANWVYSGSTDVLDQTKVKSINLTDITEQGEYGTYTLNADSLLIKIDQANENYEAKLVVEGSVTVTFKPGANVSPSVKENGVPTTLTINSDDAWTYNGQTFLSINTQKNVINIDWGTADATGTFTVIIDGATIAEALNFDGTKVVLDSKIKYNDFLNNALKNKDISLVLSDGVNA